MVLEFCVNHIENEMKKRVTTLTSVQVGLGSQVELKKQPGNFMVFDK